MNRFHIGLVVNPLAGLGGSVALKGSDGADTAALAQQLGAEAKAPQRAAQALEQLLDVAAQIKISTGAGLLGEQSCQLAGLQCEVIYQGADPSTATDSKELARRLIEDAKVDLLVFAGGDGTARDIHAICPAEQPVLGIPAGVKIHSGVYAVSPRAAGKVMAQMVRGELTTVTHADVMDIDETAFRQGTVRAKRFGELLVPAELRYVQAVKMGGRESDELVLADIAADFIESMEDDVLYIMGSGSTVAAIMEDLQLPNTLLGVDVVKNSELLAQDVTARQLEQWVITEQQPAVIVVTVIGGQGHLFGRGNQQLSAKLLAHLGNEAIRVVASKRKLQQLDGRPLLVDTGDHQVDDALAGVIRVTTGYHDEVFMQIAAP
ncbi:ATP-NAD kinase family protein [Pseudidiomarina sp. 1APP75-32.1]|uniref:ATP-NAD kinase family protein n=1 Tax=Pseudidiomarina terrestris TaxID=2820060 RepID=A0AAW7QWR2_9GAMM|nr:MULTISPECIES: ATP-NAD kinase family protein [unclassified Pseudidiomarina]MDN7123504.1 ATP-NAD kinase family protein [Pseudidiomarina sp. 1APP75-32.1]MEA3587249.1 ATP-NAD kinase family protein [Pseudidiomarina sp. 1APP75-27a]